ncbi:MAG: RdgB/HAM1 family non-canonical purine NTP pyrophosphatase [Actinobacteria bacterium]|nr:RdgB/HAM1 family non-canonical purine NTP pyrophosphatase [Actinomycetota bacterium]
MKIVIATKNDGKISEIKDFFKAKGLLDLIEILIYKDFSDFPDVKEGSRSFLSNAKIKARQIAKYCGCWALADDSGLAVDALGGRPGVISSVYAGTDASDADNREKLLKELEGIRSFEKRTARFICRMVLWDDKIGQVNLSTGICRGKIGFKEKGTGGFGYDPLFIPEGYNLTMAQISQPEKNSISHRGKALKKMSGFLAKQLY